MGDVHQPAVVKRTTFYSEPGRPEKEKKTKDVFAIYLPRVAKKLRWEEVQETSGQPLHKVSPVKIYTKKRRERGEDETPLRGVRGGESDAPKGHPKRATLMLKIFPSTIGKSQLFASKSCETEEGSERGSQIAPRGPTAAQSRGFHTTKQQTVPTFRRKAARDTVSENPEGLYLPFTAKRTTRKKMNPGPGEPLLTRKKNIRHARRGRFSDGSQRTESILTTRASPKSYRPTRKSPN